MNRHQQRGNHQVQTPKYVSNEELSRIAISFLQKSGHLNEVPVDVEAIYDAQGIRILTLPRLKKDLEIDAYISSDFGTVVVDEGCFLNAEARARFSLAHEFSHLLLHKELYEKFNIQDVESYKLFQNQIGPQIEKRIESQAHTLAGHLLVPTVHLKAFIDAATKVAGGKEKMTINDLYRLVQEACGKFFVSEGVMVRRIQAEYPDFFGEAIDV